MKQEIFLPVLGHESKYEVSNLGTVRSLERVVRVGKFGTRKINARTLSQATARGYKIVAIGGKTNYIHRLIAIAFIPNPQNKPEINHKNGIRDDNRIENLEWVTSSENVKHSFNVLNKTIDASRFFKPVDVFKEGVYIGTYKSLKSASEELSVKRTSISAVLAGKQRACRGYVFSYSKNKSQIIPVSFNQVKTSSLTNL